MNTITRKIGTNRGTPRVWLEGKVLESMSWITTDKFNCIFSDGKIEYVKSDEGSRKVAGKTGRPVIDTNSVKIQTSMGEGVTHVSAEIFMDKITITPTAAPQSLAKKAATAVTVAAIAVAGVAAPYISQFKADAKRVLVGCEFSGTVRDAFIAQGHDAISCDILPTDSVGGPHIQDDLLNHLDGDYDIGIFHPPCTFLTSAALWRNLPKHDPSGERFHKTEEALAFVQAIFDSKIPRKALENPVGCIGTRIRPASQSVQPHEYGHPESKRTCLWLDNLPLLVATDVLDVKAHGHLGTNGKWYWQNQTPTGQNKLGPSKDRWKLRSLTYQGIADAMADQWGNLSI